MSSFRLAVRDAIAQIVVQAGIVPSTTVADVSGTLVGATSFTAASSADAARFQVDGIASFWDSSGEFPVKVAAVAGSTVSLDFTGRTDSSGTPITGLQFTHAHGALVATNILQTGPNTGEQALAQTMLGNRWPVVRVFVPPSSNLWGEYHATYPKAVAMLVYQLLVDQPQAAKLQSDLWTLQQTDRTEADIAAIKQQLRSNYNLTVNGAAAVDLVEQIIQVADDRQMDARFPLYEQYLQIHVCGFRTDIDDTAAAN